MSGDENDFLTGMMAQSAPVSDEPPEADDAPEADLPETVETQVVEPEAVAAEPPPAQVAPTAPPEEQRVPLAALKSEREKRQQLEARLKELEKQPDPQPVNFYDNPEAHLEQRFQEIEARANARAYVALESAEKDVHTDYDEVAAEVIAAAQQNPAIVQQIMQAANPAREMYKVGMKLREFQKMQDPDAYRATIEAEVRAKVLAELGAQGELAEKAAAARAARADAIPPDISTRTNAAPRSGVTVTNPVNELFPKP